MLRVFSGWLLRIWIGWLRKRVLRDVSLERLNGILKSVELVNRGFLRCGHLAATWGDTKVNSLQPGKRNRQKAPKMGVSGFKYLTRRT